MDRFRILTLNIWHRETGWEARRELIRQGIAEWQPDVIGLQEVLQLTVADSIRDQAQEVAADLGYESAFGVARTLGPGLDFGNAILSRHPIRETEVIPLPGAESGETRTVLYARLDAPIGDVPVFVTHLNWKLHHGSVRVRQVKALVDSVSERVPIGRSYPPVVMGDFNAEPTSDEIRYMCGLATLERRSVFFADAWIYAGDDTPGYTFDRRNPYAARSHEPPRRLDYIFVRGPDRRFRGEPLHTRVVFDEPVDNVWASDHFGVYTELSA